MSLFIEASLDSSTLFVSGTRMLVYTLFLFGNTKLSVSAWGASSFSIHKLRVMYAQFFLSTIKLQKNVRSTSARPSKPCMQAHVCCTSDYITSIKVL